MTPDRQTDNRQTTDPAPELEYASIRVTLDHKYLRQLVDCISDVSDYCIYEHKRGTNNEHFHICLPGPTDTNRVDKYKNRIKRRFGESGNGFISGKGYKNGLHKFVFYCAHEATNPRYEDPKWAIIVKEQLEKGVFIKKSPGNLRNHGVTVGDDDESKWSRDRAWQLNYMNVVRVAVRYHYKYKTPPTLIATLKHMMDHSKWRPSKDLDRGKLTTFLVRDFEYQIKTRPQNDYGWICVNDN